MISSRKRADRGRPGESGGVFGSAVARAVYPEASLIRCPEPRAALQQTQQQQKGLGIARPGKEPGMQMDLAELIAVN